MYAAPGPNAVVLLCSEGGSPDCQGAQEGLVATAVFTSVDVLDTTSGTPTLSQISGYGAVMAETDNTPSNGTALGNLLAAYYALGGKHLTICTYGFSNPWEIGGNVMTGADAALTNVGSNGTVSGNIVATVPGDPIFTGVNLATVTFSNNDNYAHPGLASGATLLATDGAGVDMIARSSGGVINFNAWPASEGASASFYQLLANMLTNGAPSSGTPTTPAPPTWVLMGAGFLGLALYQTRARWARGPIAR